MKTYKEEVFKGERALFQADHIKVIDSVFEDGESPLKESSYVDVDQSIFRWRYPLWYSHDISVKNSTFLDTSRAGIWYTDNISIENSVVSAPKTIRKCHHITLKHVDFTDAVETLWNNTDVTIDHVNVKGDYFGMNLQDATIDHLRLDGKYPFDNSKNITVRNSRFITKDCFWNSENITIYDSTIIGEYFGWNSKNITLVNCTIESLQGLCYIENLKMVNCKLINTTLAFEYCSNIDAEIVSHIDSVMNPTSGIIKAESIGELIMDETKIDPAKTEIIVTKPVSKLSNKDIKLCICN